MAAGQPYHDGLPIRVDQHQEAAACSHSLPHDPATVEFDPLLRRLNLANTRRRWRELLERAETQGWSCREFRGVVITEEIAHRQQTRNPALGQTGSLPVPEDRLPRYPEWLHRSLRHRRGADRELVGGQPSRQIARGTRSLPAAARPDHRRSWLSIYPTDRDAANVLFHIVNERNQRRRPMLFTTNKPPLTTWGDVLHDHDLAEAIVDRVLERGRLLLLDGPSHRARHLDLPLTTLIMAATNRPEFPEINRQIFRNPQKINRTAGPPGLVWSSAENGGRSQRSWARR